ncbi:MAG: alcohol dehydrogenase catalytic domain-containing protein, partial [Syntrophobacteraceae bacterium]
MLIRAAILYETNAPLLVEAISAPPPGYGQVCVEVAFSGVCRSQLMEARGKRGTDRYLPHLLGHEASGKVISIGEGTTKVKPGDKVILGWIKGNGLDVGGPDFRWGDRIIHAGPVTTLSTHTIVSENRCTLLPEGIPPDLAMLFGCAVPTGAGIVLNQVKPVDGSTIALFGLGGVGISALMALNLFNCSNVITVDIEESKLALARECGAT